MTQVFWRLWMNCVFSGLTIWQHPSFFAYFPTANTFEGMLGDLYSTSTANPGFNVRDLLKLITVKLQSWPAQSFFLLSGMQVPHVLNLRLSSWIGVPNFLASMKYFIMRKASEAAFSRFEFLTILRCFPSEILFLLTRQLNRLRLLILPWLRWWQHVLCIHALTRMSILANSSFTQRHKRIHSERRQLWYWACRIVHWRWLLKTSFPCVEVLYVLHWKKTSKLVYIHSSWESTTV